MSNVESYAYIMLIIDSQRKQLSQYVRSYIEAVSSIKAVLAQEYWGEEN